MRTSARRSSRSARTSPTRPRSGSTGTSGPSGRRSGPGSGSPRLSNGFASCDDPDALQLICDRLQPGTIEVFAQRWLHRLPMPFGPADQDAGYWWELSMRQVEVSRTVVFDAPRRARAFFEALIGDNLDIGRPANVEIIFGRRIRRDTPGTFRTAIDRPAIGPDAGGVVAQRLLQALADQAVPQRRPRDADRDRHQRTPRPGLQRPPAQPRRTPGQGPHLQPPYPECRTCRPGHRPRESSL